MPAKGTSPGGSLTCVFEFDSSCTDALEDCLK